MPEIIINGPAGRIEGRYHHSKDANAPIALLLHPHPQHGGTMNNKVVYTLYHAFVRQGFSALRFNFRGVGRSQGSFARGEGELSDAASALDWLQSYNANATACWIDGFISVAPPANLYDFGFLAPCPSSGLIIHGDKDHLVPLESVQKLINKLMHQRDITIDFRLVRGADHFFQNRLEELDEEVEDYLTKKPKQHKIAASGR